MAKLIPGVGENSKQTKRRRCMGVIVAVVLIVLILAGVVAWYGIHKKQAMTASKPAGVTLDQKALEADTRSNAVKIAAATASAQAANGDTDDAAKTLDGAVGETNNNDEKVSLYLQLATVYANVGQRDQALAAEANAMKLSPDDWRLYKNQGAVYEQLGDVANAKASYQKADDLLKNTADYTTYHNELMGLIAHAGEQ